MRWEEQMKMKGKKYWDGINELRERDEEIMKGKR
jgi:hypothetical protein